MDDQDLVRILEAWQAGQFGYRETLQRTGVPSLFALYAEARRLGVPLRKELLPREKRAVDPATQDLLNVF